MDTLSSKQEDRVSDIEYSVSPPNPKEMYLELNNICNHKCSFCSNVKMQRSKKNMDEELARRIMHEGVILGVTDITFFATGEPFVIKNLDEYVKYAKQLGYEYVFLTSNASLAVPEIAKRVIDAGLDSIKFSINAGTKETYKIVHGKDDFDKVINNILWFYKYKTDNHIDIKLYASMVPTDKSRGEYDKLMDKIGHCLDDDIHMRECSNQGGNMFENNDTVIINPDNILGTLKPNQYQEKKICPDPFNRIVVSSEGYLTACVVDYQNSLVVADLSTASLKDAWYSMKFLKLRNNHLAGDLYNTLCYNCLYNKNDAFTPLSPEFFRPFKY